MNIPKNLKYTKDHEWVLIEDGVATIGITDYAQNELGDIVYVELPEVGKLVTKGDAVSTIEAVKTVADVYSPLSGEVNEVNETLADTAEIINKDPYGEGWIFKLKISNKDEINDLLTAEDYKKLL
ncbi:MAG: glycine cleavage system protein GcvH [Candidatus Marinimicrobia bacterium]|nr:glycine cleavage system protein GcvH [Candidatus Neomarinimicrobiota bacterium]